MYNFIINKYNFFQSRLHINKQLKPYYNSFVYSKFKKKVPKLTKKKKFTK